MARSGVIVIENNHLALIKRVREKRTYYTFPGGGIEPGETPEQAAIREALEELGVHVVLERLAAQVELVDMHPRAARRKQFYFLAHVESGVFGTGTGVEFSAARIAARGSYTPVWVPLDELPNLVVLPTLLAASLPQIVRQTTPLNIKETQ
jgi:ADP-ribose pyrophosphatase